MRNPGISVIVPVYRTEKYIRRCLESIINQTYENIEIICVYKNYPDDQSINILHEFHSKDSRIILLEQKSKGLSGARNEGVEVASGKYLYFVDSDDWLEKDTLDSIYKHMNQDDLDVLCFDANVIYESEDEKNKKVFNFLNKKNNYKGIFNGKNLFVKMMKQNEFAMTVWVNAFKREFIMQNQISFIENIYHEDNPYTVECFLKAKKIRHVKKKLYNYFICEGSLSMSTTPRNELYSCVVVYQYFIFLAQQERQADVRYQLIQYASIFLSKILNNNDALTREEKEFFEVEDPIIDIIFKSMKIGKYEIEEYDIDLYIEAWKSKISKAEHIILYGAGSMGQFVYNYLKKQQYQNKVLAFAETSINDNSRYIEGKPIFCLDEIEKKYNNDSILLIVSVDSKLSNELFQNCKKRNINNVIRMDRKIIHYIISELGGAEK